MNTIYLFFLSAPHAMAGAVRASISLDGVVLHTLERPAGGAIEAAKREAAKQGERGGEMPPSQETHPPPFPGTPSDALAALKLDTGAFLTAHMAAAGVEAAGEEPNMLEEEVSGDDGEGADGKDGRPHAGKRKRRGKAGA